MTLAPERPATRTRKPATAAVPDQVYVIRETITMIQAQGYSDVEREYRLDLGYLLTAPEAVAEVQRLNTQYLRSVEPKYRQYVAARNAAAARSAAPPPPPLTLGEWARNQSSYTEYTFEPIHRRVPKNSV